MSPKIKVFIVDDSNLMRERLIAVLSQKSDILIVGQAEGVSGTLDRIVETQPHYVFLDIRIKDGNGMQLLQKIKQWPDPPIVVMLTNFPHPEYQKRCFELGADFFFDKSSEFNDVVAVLYREDQNA